ncbi:MAG: hypothetical protein ACI4SY_01795, partial [Sutterella sp.]
MKSRLAFAAVLAALCALPDAAPAFPFAGGPLYEVKNAPVAPEMRVTVEQAVRRYRWCRDVRWNDELKENGRRLVSVSCTLRHAPALGSAARDD